VSARTGAAGRLAGAFVASRLTLLLILASVGLGAFAVLALPREEEPQIIVPMIDVFVDMPGLTPTEIERRVTQPLEQLLREIPGVEYLYSTSSQGRSMVVVRFTVGEDETAALVRLNQKLAANMDRVPPGAGPPIVRARSIDDVPILAITLWGNGYGDDQLRQIAAEMAVAIKTVTDVSEVTIIGGRGRAVRVELDPARLAAYGLDPIGVRDAIVAANGRASATGPTREGATTEVRSGLFLQEARDLETLVVASRRGRPVSLGDVATIVDGDTRPSSHVAFHTRDRAWPAVTVSVAKRKGTNAIDVADRVRRQIELLRGRALPNDLQATITRNYGETAAHKSNELLWHMLLAVLSVSALIWLALGRREAAVVLLAIPVTLALTLFTFYLYGYTLNRITLFALIFSIGILVDDAIVVIENVVRHARGRTGEDGAFAALVVRAVDEVGNPTILATLTVIAAILPMAFVGGLMGPYMRPIPVGASAAMLFSLVVAFIVTPWAAVRLLKSSAGHADEREDWLTRRYRRAMRRLLLEPRVRVAFLGGVVLLLVAAMALVPLQLVRVKMLPFDNKSEFQVLIDLPEGTALEQTARVTAALADATASDPVVRDVQSYVGAAAPYNFNGLVRHYFLRRAPHLADLQVNLAPQDERSEQSHEAAARVRQRLLPIARRFGATIQVAEVPPGPPVLQTMVAEVYGPDAARRHELADQVRALMARTPGVVDVDWYVEEPHPRIDLVVDAAKAAAAGLAPASVAAAVRMAADGETAGLIHDERAAEDVPIVLALPRARLGDLADLASLRLGGTATVAIGEVTRPVRSLVEPAIYHKNLQPVTYVTADLAGESESPVYAILAMNRELKTIVLPEGYDLEIFNARQPTDTGRYAMKWDGEWHVTIEVFRDLGLAFAAVLVLIYLLVVGWFESFTTPIAIMAAIPFSLVGILPAHAAMGAFFTATSMIGFIAGAGIVVRNSIILVDFIELRLAEGRALEEAVIDAGAVRFRPMALTAAAVIVGASVILFDPIFQGLAVSLMAGEAAALLLSRVTVPVLYYLFRRTS
jgi:multidrug efflux pump subunit AcrB